MRAIIGEVPLVCTIYMGAYVLEHQDIYSRLVKAEPQGITEASTHPAHMTRLLGQLPSEQQLTMDYFMLS